MKIILSGGGTLGPVTPLIAIYETLKKAHPQAEFVWVGTKTGPEKALIQSRGIKFIAITSGKIRRYGSLLNFVDLFKIFIGLLQSLKLIWMETPHLCISAGGYVSVPLHFAAWLFGEKTWIHQQDVKITLSNRLMSPIASVITVALPHQKKMFLKRKTVLLGSPIRSDVFGGSKDEAIKLFSLEPGLPIILAMGGGTGSMRVDELVMEAVPHLRGIAQIIHLTGSERPIGMAERASETFPYYHVFRFLTAEMKHALAVADLVISRGGFGSLTELAALKKPAIVVPKPGHQFNNVKFLAGAGAVRLLDERTTSGIHLAALVKELLQADVVRERMGEEMNILLPRAEESRISSIADKLLS